MQILSIKSEAKNKAHILSKNLTLISFIVLTTSWFCFQLYNLPNFSSTIIDISKKPLANMILIGDSFAIKQYFNSITNNGQITGIWLYDQSDKLIFDRNMKKNIIFLSENIAVSIKNFQPYLITKHQIEHKIAPNGFLGTLFCSQRIKLQNFAFGFFIIAFILLIFRRFIANSYSLFAENLMRPFINLAEASKKREIYQDLYMKDQDLLYIEVKQVYDSLKQSDLDLKEKTRSHAIIRTVQMIGHDIKKPFTMLSFLLNYMDQNIKINDDSNTLIKNFKSEVDRSLKLANGLITDVMEVISDKKIESEDVSLNKIISEALNYVFSYEEKNIRLQYDLKHKNLVCVDPDKIIRVFINILSNGLSACEDYGTIELRTKNISEKIIKVTLGNSGVPVSKDSQNEIFNDFYTSGKKNGTGLGLAICKKIISAHHCEIVCEPQKNGTEFIFSLPAAKGEDSLADETIKFPSCSKELKKGFLCSSEDNIVC